MTLKFLGDYARLKKCVSRTGVTGQWRELKNGHKQFRTTGGAILNWWESSGTIQFQGRDPAMKFEQGFIASAKGRCSKKAARICRICRICRKKMLRSGNCSRIRLSKRRH